MPISNKLYASMLVSLRTAHTASVIGKFYSTKIGEVLEIADYKKQLEKNINS